MVIDVPDAIRIALSNGGYTLIDSDDYHKVIQYVWRSAFDYSTQTCYAKSGRGKTTKNLHKLILDTNNRVDHKNHDTLDNRKDNLREVTNSQNMQNRKGAQYNSKTGVRGVHYSVQNKKYHAKVTVMYKVVYSAFFDNLEDAEKAVIEARTKYMTHSDGR